MVFKINYFIFCIIFFFFKQKTAYEIYQCDWSSDVCSSDLERFLDGEQICSDDYVFPTTREIINFIENNKDAVGYGGYGFKGNINFAKINSVLPDSITIRNDKYPVTRYLHFYTIDEPKGDVKAFINWVISEEGQKIIEREGFISIWK